MAARDDVTNVKTKRKEKSEAQLKYQRYLRSKQFDEVRKLVKERDNYTCQCCNRGLEDIAGKHITFNVHHRTYDHLFEGGETEANDCILLCNICHSGIHKPVSNKQRFKMK